MDIREPQTAEPQKIGAPAADMLAGQDAAMAGDWPPFTIAAKSGKGRLDRRKPRREAWCGFSHAGLMPI